MLAYEATSEKRDWNSKRREKSREREIWLTKDRVMRMTIRLKECRRLGKKREWRGGRVCVWHESVCLCHTGLGIFSPLLCLGDANWRRSPNLAFRPTCISTQFCLVLVLKTRRWRTVREESEADATRNEKIERRKPAESQTVWLRRGEIRAGEKEKKNCKIERKKERERGRKGLWEIHIIVINQRSWYTCTAFSNTLGGKISTQGT